MFDSLKKIFSNNNGDRYVKLLETIKKDNDKFSSFSTFKSEKVNIGISLIDISTPNMYLTHLAARMCVGKDPIEKIIDDYDKFNKIATHVEKYVGMGHESITEHTNIISMINIENEVFSSEVAFDLSEILSNMKFCNVVVRNNNILIGGSVRAYMNILRETNKNNIFYSTIKYIICNSIEKQFLSSLISNGIVNEDECNFLPEFKIKKINEDDNCELEVFPYNNPITELNKHVKIVYEQDVNNVYESIKEYGFELYDAMKVSTISIIFEGISRACANQIVRHRNGISQESQRYVKHECSDDAFINPFKINKERYEKIDTESLINNLNDPFYNYKYLIDNNILKEDARAWLPMNVSTKLIMTFTYKNLAYFLNLRSNKSAQTEVRLLSDSIKEYIESKFPDFIEYNTEIYYNLSKQKNEEDYDNKYYYQETTIEESNNNESVDEIIEDSEEEVKEPETSKSNPESINIDSIDDAKEYMRKAMNK